MSRLDGRKIALLTLQHFSNAPRAQKESAALANAGADVTVFGSWWDHDRSVEDIKLASDYGIKYEPLVDFRLGSKDRALPRVVGRLAKELFCRFGLVLPEVFGPTSRRMVRAVVELQPDLTMVHCEPGLWAGRQLMDKGFRVGVDFEDWFSEDLPIADRKNRPVGQLRELEKHFVRCAKPQFATTQCMAESLKTLAGGSEAPTAIPNAFPWSSRPVLRDQRRTANAVRFFWFSQTIGPMRGLEELASVFRSIRGRWELHLLGSVGRYQEWFTETFSDLEGRVSVHRPVTNRELPEKAASFDVGLALEMPHCKNNAVTASNKIFEYLRCGLPVIATDTPGQVEVMSKSFGAGWLVSSSRTDQLRNVVQKVVDDPSILAHAHSAALYAAEHVWAWERFEPVLVQSVFESLGDVR